MSEPNNPESGPQPAAFPPGDYYTAQQPPAGPPQDTPPQDTPPLTYPPAPPPPPPGYGYGYPPPPGYGYAPYPVPLARQTNGMAITALIMLFVFPPLAIVFGAIGRSQIRRTNEEGHGMATAGFIGGIVLSVFYVVFLVLMIVFWVHLFNTAVNDPYYN
jgi:hypothetical protein